MSGQYPWGWDMNNNFNGRDYGVLPNRCGSTGMMFQRRNVPIRPGSEGRGYHGCAGPAYHRSLTMAGRVPRENSPGFQRSHFDGFRDTLRLQIPAFPRGQTYYGQGYGGEQTFRYGKFREPRMNGAPF